MLNHQNVLIAPLVTEKAGDLQEIGKKTGKRTTKYSFIIHPDANKTMVKDAIKSIYNVKASSVNIAVYCRKVKKFRNMPSLRPHWKKAIVTFNDGVVLEFAKG